MGLLLVLLIGIAAGAYLTFFSLSNQQRVSLNMLGGLVLSDATMWQIVTVCLAIGMGVAVVLLLPSLLKAVGSARSYKSELQRTQEMLEEERRRRPTIISPPARPASAAPEPPPAVPAAGQADGADPPA